MPPKTWNRTLPSSGRWSFKLALETTRTDPSSPGPGNGNGSADTTSTAHGGDGGGGGGDEAAATAQLLNQTQELEGSRGDGGSPPSGEDGQTKEQTRAQQQGNGNLEAAAAGSTSAAPGDRAPPPELGASATPSTDGVVAGGGASARPQETPPAVSARERGIDNWPGRAACREVAEKVLGWEFQDGDFVLPAARGGGTWRRSRRRTGARRRAVGQGTRRSRERTRPPSRRRWLGGR